MTLDEAIAIREQELNGHPGDAFMARVALEVIRSYGAKMQRFRPESVLREVMNLLNGGPVDREKFHTQVRRSKLTYEASRKLVEEGLIKCEVRLTPEGLRALGLRGPT